MAVTDKNVHGTKRGSLSKPSKLYSYTIRRDEQLKVLREHYSARKSSLTVLSTEPVKGLRSKRLDDVLLKNGRKAVAITPNDTPTPVVVAADDAIAQSAFEPNAKARALLLGLEIAQEDLKAAGGAYDLDQVCALLQGVSRQRVERRVREGSLLAVPGPSNRRRYPVIQFMDDGSVVDGLKELHEALAFSSPWSVLNYLINPDDRLDGERPIDLLRRGELGRVLESARRVGTQGA